MFGLTGEGSLAVGAFVSVKRSVSVWLTPKRSKKVKIKIKKIDKKQRGRFTLYLSNKAIFARVLLARRRHMCKQKDAMVRHMCARPSSGGFRLFVNYFR